MMACQLVALDKRPGVRPVGIGETIRRLLAKCVVKEAGAQAMQAASNLNLCAGLPAGIEGAVHAIMARWDDPPPRPPRMIPTPILWHAYLLTHGTRSMS